MHMPPARNANCRNQGLIKQPCLGQHWLPPVLIKHCVTGKWPRPFTHYLSLFSSSNSRDIATETIQAAKPKIFTICPFKEKLAGAWSVSRPTWRWTLGLIQHFPRSLWTSRYRVMDQAVDPRTRALTWELQKWDECPVLLFGSYIALAAHRTFESGVSQLSNGRSESNWGLCQVQPQLDLIITIIMKANRECVLRMCRVSC